MWPFTRQPRLPVSEAISLATEFASEQWIGFCERAGVPTTINLRDRVSYFAADVRPKMARRFPMLRAAPDDVMLLIIAQGIERTGQVSRRLIELQLGIILPGSV